MLKIPEIYPITDTRLSGISHAEQVKRLIKGGAEFIQLRDKYSTPKDFYESASEALKIARKANVKLIINDRVDIALALKADGVHLGQDDLPPASARKILGEQAIIGFSTHNIEQANTASKFPIDYIAFGPVFGTTTKETPDKTTGIEMIKNVREIVGEIPLVAIGGITLKNYQEVLDAGADSVAIISNLISDAENISRKMREFLKQ
jgi:thiamine-phosphate pyrophosphorylase